MAMIATGALMAPTAAFAIDAGELPSGGTVVGGDANFDYSEPNKLDVHQNTDRTVINWDSFNIGKDATTQFYQPNSNSLAVNRVYSKGVDPTQILGKLIANGKVMVLDRNGVIFGKDSVVDVGGIIASTGDINVDQIMSGSNKIDISNISDAAVVNNGLINVHEAGLAGLVAKTAVNNGVIKAKVGRVALASGEKATVDLYGDNLIEIAADSNLETALVSNSGKIIAEGGTVQLTASAAKNAVDSVVNMDGIVDVSSVEVKGGKIILGGGDIKVSGKLKADGKTGGGKIYVKGKNVTIAKDAEIAANAIETGKGGTVDLIADDVMSFEGLITARGGALSGNGGDVEVSGYEGLAYSGFADLTAANGEMGNLLLDPRFMVIYSGALPVGVFQQYVMSSATLSAQLRGGNVTLQADDFIDVGTRNGTYNVNVGGALTNFAVNTMLNALADGSVNVSNFLGTTTGNLTLRSQTVNMNRNLVMGSGSVTVDAPTLNLNAGVYASNGTTLLGDNRLTGVSALSTINVGGNGKINQGIAFSDDASALTTINVASGLYNETVLLNKSNIALNGANAGKAGNDTTRGAASIIDPNSPGIRVTADNVTVDGFNVVGTSDTDGYGIWIDGADNVKLRNNVITGTSTDGIHVNDAAGFNITRNSISSVLSTGADTGSGIYVIDSSGTIGGATAADGNVISGTAWDGIKSTYSTLTVSNNDISNVARAGLYVLWGNDFSVSNNLIANAGREGVYLQNFGPGTKMISGNTIYNVGLDGIRADSIDNVTITGNSIGLGADGVLDAGDTLLSRIGNDGIRLAGSSNANVSGNNVANTNRYGIVATNGKTPVTNNIVSGNAIDNTGNAGIYLLGSVDSFVTSNTIGTLGSAINGDGIKVENSSGADIDGNTINGTTSSGNDIGNGIYVLSSNDVTVGANAANTISDVAWDGIRFSLSNGTIASNTITNVDRAGVYAFGGTNLDVTGNIISDTGREGIMYENFAFGGVNNVIGNNVYDIGMDGIRANAVDGITISGNLVGLGADGVLNAGDETTARVGIDGIRLAGSSNATVSGNIVANTDRYGVVVTNGKAFADGTTVSGNTIDSTGNAGVYFLRTLNNTISRNIIGTNAGDNINGDGIKIELSDATSVTGNTIANTVSTGNDIGNGVYVIGSNDVTIGGAGALANAISNTGWDGVRFSVSNGSIDNNSITNADRAGVYAFGGTNVDVTANVISDTGREGVMYENFAFGGVNNIISNNIYNIGMDGIRANSVDSVNIDDNLIGVGADGILNAGDDTTARIGIDGIRLAGTSNATVTNNIVANTNRHGIVATNGGSAVTNNTITGNTIDAIGQHGIYLIQSNNTLLQDNNIGLGFDLISGTADDTAVGSDGIRVANSLLASILDNLIANASGSGVYVGDTTGTNTVAVAGNEVTNSTTGMTFESGLIDLTGGANTITGGSLGYRFAPNIGNSVNLVGNTIGATIFETPFFVELANGALFNPGTPTVIDATGASFNGFTPGGTTLTQAQYDFMEARMFHFNDDATLGLFFFGLAPLIDQSDIFRDIAGIPGAAGRFSITIRGLPRIAGVTVPTATGGAASPGFSMNDITPAAGGDEDGQQTTSAQNPAQIEPAAGAGESIVEANSWNAAIDAASQGQTVNYSFSGDGSDILASGL